MIAAAAHSSTSLAISLLGDGADNVRYVAFVLFFIGLALTFGVLQRLFRLSVAAARGLAVSDRDRLSIVATVRNLGLGLMFLALGGMTFWFASSLNAVAAFTKEVQIGVLRYEGLDDKGNLILVYFPTDENGEYEKDPEGNPVGMVRTTSPGDSIRLSYTLVRVEDNWLTVGVDQMYKIDFISGWYTNEDQMNFSSRRPTFQKIENGRDENLVRLQNAENRSFPYSMWVKGVRISADHVPLIDPTTGELPDPPREWKVILAHNTILLAESVEEAVAREAQQDDDE